MAAIITTPFRVLNAENFKEDIAASDTSVYLGIGKSDVWSTNSSDLTDTIPFTPGDHIHDTNDAWGQMIALKKITASDVSHVVPRHDYADGEEYVAWDSKDSDIYDDKFYVITSEFKVYKCIEAGSGVTSVQPTHVGADIPAAGGDGYRWKYMYTVTTADSEKFLTKSFMPVKTLAESPGLSETNVDRPQQLSQINSRALGTAAGIERIVIENGGQNYDAADDFTITIEGDGTGATVHENTSGTNAITFGPGGSITSITVNAKGTDYTKAKVVITAENDSGGAAGSGCIARAVLAPEGGHGTDPVSELGAFFVALNVQLDGNEGDLTVNQDFRQISIIKNPYSSGTTVATATTLKATKGLQLASGQNTTGFVVDQVIQAASGGSGAKAYLVEIDATNRQLYYYQNDKTGYIPFQNTDTIEGTLPSGGSATLASSHNIAADVVAGSGQFVFLENRDPISRSATQIEDIKCIIEF